MDPNENWRQQREIAQGILADQAEITALSFYELHELGEQAYRLAGLVADLHDWLEKGGFPPQAWSTLRRA